MEYFWEGLVSRSDAGAQLGKTPAHRNKVTQENWSPEVMPICSLHERSWGKKSPGCHMSGCLGSLLPYAPTRAECPPDMSRTRLARLSSVQDRHKMGQHQHSQTRPVADSVDLPCKWTDTQVHQQSMGSFCILIVHPLITRCQLLAFPLQFRDYTYDFPHFRQMLHHWAPFSALFWRGRVSLHGLGLP